MGADQRPGMGARTSRDTGVSGGFRSRGTSPAKAFALLTPGLSGSCISPDAARKPWLSVCRWDE